MDLIKTSWEKFCIYFDFSLDLFTDESIDSFTLVCVNNLTGEDESSAVIDSSSSSAGLITAWIKSGTRDADYEITAKATSDLGNVYEKEIILGIRDDVSDVIMKEPDEIFAVMVDFGNDIASGDILASATATIENTDGTDLSTTMIVMQDVDDPNLIVVIQEGDNESMYFIHARGITGLGEQYEKIIRLNVIEI